MRKVVISLFHRVVSHYGEVVQKHRSVLVVCIQLGLIAAANVTAFTLRFEGEIPSDQVRLLLRGLPLVLTIHGGGLVIFGIQRGLWRYVGLYDLGRIFGGTVISSVVSYGVLHGFLGWVEYPRSVIILTGVFSGLFLAGIRLAVCWFREWLQVVSPTARRVLVVGAGHAGELLVRAMLSDGGGYYRPVGLVDDDPIKWKMKIHGVPVVGAIVDIPALAHGLVAHEILVASPSASTGLKQRILAASEGCRSPSRSCRV